MQGNRPEQKAEEDERQEVFRCRQCGECCRGEKGILVTPAEEKAMAAHLGLSAAEFARRFLVETSLGPQLASSQGRCVMQVGSLCRVHPVKPRICREWPFLRALMEDAEEFAAAKEACPGLAPEAPHEAFVRAGRQHLE